MIKSIRHKGLKLLWEEGKASKLPADQVSRIERILNAIHLAQQVPQDFELFKHWRIHPLKGELKGYWSLTVKENWRIIFKFDSQDAYDINYIDYH